MTRAGFVAIAGRPNAGKSTLLNRIVGRRLSIVTPKPQTTRDRVVGLVTTDDTQMVFLDTPGLFEPGNLLHKAMHRSARAALDDADVIVHLLDATREEQQSLAAVAGHGFKPASPILTVFNKLDSISAARHAALQDANPGAAVISALSGEGVEQLLAAIAAALPESPFLYPEDDASSQSVRFFVREMIREAAMRQLSDEIPYGIACEIEEFREASDPVYIRAVIHVERESHKGMVVGARGSRIKEIGKAARSRIEEFVGRHIYLDLRVKVLANWSKNRNLLNRLGYMAPEEND